MDIKGIFSSILKGAGSITGIGLLSEAGKALEDKELEPEQKAILEKQLQDFSLTVFRAEIEDRANARSRELELAKAGTKDMTTKILAYGIVGGAVLLEGGLLFVGYPVNVPGEVVGRILGTFDAAAMLVLSYYFGSSMGSKIKDETISKMG